MLKLFWGVAAHPAVPHCNVVQFAPGYVCVSEYDSVRATRVTQPGVATIVAAERWMKRI